MAFDLEQTVTAAGTGDATAVEALLVRFLPGLERHLARNAGALVRRNESAADLAQSVCREVLMRLRDERVEYRGPAAFQKWLYQAALHKLQNRHRHYRADKRDGLRDVDPGEAGVVDLARSQTSPSGHAMRREDNDQLAMAMAAMTERDRQILQWCHFDYLGHAEVAARLGITESHSRVLLARAMARLAHLAGK
ncbi:MAG: sigma-70 family RNA polymerase sigma factor [Planctomycetes bacterium]|nr:sigma-70 family RNA polymerase sigma factor [Planctomycetota bacterium]